MPELPEVQTTVDGLNKRVKGLSVRDVWTDYKSSFHKGRGNIKNPEYFESFKNDVVGAKFVKAEREGKNVLIHLSNKRTILVHMKMTGHFMYGNYVHVEATSEQKETWVAKDPGPLRDDPYNRFIHLVFTLSSGKQLVFSDLRKFGKVFLFETESRHTIEDLMHLGPDPLRKSFTYETIQERLSMKPSGKIKQVLMDQTIISGVGNIYSDEMLWSAGIHPLSKTGNVPRASLKKLFSAMKQTLEKGIDFGGDSDSDYRNIDGLRGEFQHRHNAYRKTGKPCPKKDSGTIERLKIGGRSAHFCPTHQILY